MTRTFSMEPHCSKCALTTSSLTSNGRLPRNTECFVSCCDRGVDKILTLIHLSIYHHLYHWQQSKEFWKTRWGFLRFHLYSYMYLIIYRLYNKSFYLLILDEWTKFDLVEAWIKDVWFNLWVLLSTGLSNPILFCFFVWTVRHEINKHRVRLINQYLSAVASEIHSDVVVAN